MFTTLCQASALDPKEPVTLTVDLGGQQKLESLSLAWEFPAKSFAVSVSSDGVKWTEVFATDSNLLASTQVFLGSVTATKVRVIMHEVHSLHILAEKIYLSHDGVLRRMRCMALSRVRYQSATLIFKPLT